MLERSVKPVVPSTSQVNPTLARNVAHAPRALARTLAHALL